MPPTRPPLPTAHQQVLGIDQNLLQEVLSFLGTDIAECHAALLVSHFWNDALERTNPWLRILQRDYPSMADSSFSLAHDRQHQLFHRTVKALLGLRLVGANQEASRKRELRRLEEQFRDKCVTLAIRHPRHGVIAESKIAITQCEGVSSGEDFFSDERNKELKVHCDFDKLRISDFQDCFVEWQMPGGLKLVKVEVLEIEDYYSDEVDDYLSLIYWMISAAKPEGVGTGIRFLDHFFYDDLDCFLQISVPCGYYSSQVFFRMDLRQRELVPRESHFKHITGAHIFRIDVPSLPSYKTSAFEYLKVMDSWMVAARHLQDDVMEVARLKSRFEKAYLLVEVGVRADLIVGSADEDEDENECQDESEVEKEDESQDESEHTTDRAVDIVAYVLVSLVDEAALLDLFDTQSTHLQFLEREGSTGRLPSVEDRFVRISILDLKENRMVKLSEGGFFWRITSDGDPEERCRITTPCQFVCFDEMIEVEPTFGEEVITSGEGGDQYAVTVNLFIAYARDRDDDDDEEDWQEGVWNNSECLDLWKILEICMTGEAV